MLTRCQGLHKLVCYQDIVGCKNFPIAVTLGTSVVLCCYRFSTVETGGRVVFKVTALPRPKSFDLCRLGARAYTNLSATRILWDAKIFQ